MPMIIKRASLTDMPAVVSVLSAAFEKNKSVGYIVGSAAGRMARIHKLMEYSFLSCMDFGRVWLSENRRCCALVMFPDRKRNSIRAVWRDVKLILTVVGLSSVVRVLKRASLIRSRYPCDHIFYIWFIGCDPVLQGKGLGSEMMEFLLAEAECMGRSVYLETSVKRNVAWYRKLGFELYDQPDLDYRLYFLRKKH